VGDDDHDPAVTDELPHDLQQILADHLRAGDGGGFVEGNTCGSMARERARVTLPQCLRGLGAAPSCRPAESRTGYFSACEATPTRWRRSRQRWSARSFSRPRTSVRAGATFRGAVLRANRPKDRKTTPTSARSPASGRPFSGGRCPPGPDDAGPDGFQPVDRPAQGGLPRPRGADDREPAPLADGEVDVLRDTQFPRSTCRRHAARTADRQRCPPLLTVSRASGAATCPRGAGRSNDTRISGHEP
jgi:hypothetical protein